jgi:hypothetical protein
MIDRADIMGARLDTLVNLMEGIIRYEQVHGPQEFLLFKSDVAAAYRRLILHFLYQLKQIVTIDGERHVDHCTTFGGRGSSKCWTAFFGLVIWICIFVKFIQDLFAYMDDTYSFEEEGKVLWYEPYECYYPAKQTKLLLLWDEIGLPHEKSKQEYGRTLRIIGFMVDPNAKRISMDDEDRIKLIDHITDFVATVKGGTRRTLREFQQLAGWINWSLNVYPLLKPGLSNVYDKISGKTESHAKIYVNKGVVDDLSWFLDHVKVSDGVHFFKTTDWSVNDADVIAFTDACAYGMAYFFADSRQGFQSPLPHGPPKDSIFYFEALAVCSCILAATSLSPVPKRLAVFSDSSNTVDIFNSLRATPVYNDILKTAVSSLITFDIDLRVAHIPGTENVVADALSRFQNAPALAACPGLTISSFQPPRVTMGRVKK